MTWAECVGKHYNACKRIINTAHQVNKAAFANANFPNGVDEIKYELVEVRPNLSYDDVDADPNKLLLADNYNMVGLRMDEAEEYVVGVHGDGVIEYPYPWCVSHNNEQGYICVPVGPWDCYYEAFDKRFTAEECCNLISASFPFADIHGNNMECYVSPQPAADTSAPDLGRVELHISADNRVAHPPKQG